MNFAASAASCLSILVAGLYRKQLEHLSVENLSDGGGDGSGGG